MEWDHTLFIGHPTRLVFSHPPAAGEIVSSSPVAHMEKQKQGSSFLLYLMKANCYIVVGTSFLDSFRVGSAMVENTSKEGTEKAAF